MTTAPRRASPKPTVRSSPNGRTAPTQTTIPLVYDVLQGRRVPVNWVPETSPGFVTHYELQTYVDRITYDFHTRIGQVWSGPVDMRGVIDFFTRIDASVSIIATRDEQDGHLDAVYFKDGLDWQSWPLYCRDQRMAEGAGCACAEWEARLRARAAQRGRN